jgi:hypothetical protein
LDYRVAAELSQLCLPAPVVAAPGAAAARADELWRHTCLEVFVAARGSQGYREFNFSPSGAWALYAFSAYRAGMTVPALGNPPGMRWQRGAGLLELEVSLPAESLPAGDDGFRLALSAVIEEQSGTISYWALTHPAGQPDFHHPGSFVLET